jgi:glycine/D-amino acid oxidase-like deaminating enzyme
MAMLNSAMPDIAPPSYYEATRNRHDRWPALAGAISADVCIVGGGYTGIATALELIERGLSVVLLEARTIGWGASGRNGGQLIRGLCEVDKIEKRLGREAGELFWRMGVDCVQIVRERIERFGIDCDLRWGFADVAIKARQFDALRAHVDELHERRYPHAVELVERDQLAQKVVASERYVGALIDRGSGHLHPLNLCLGEAAAASALGVRIFENSPVVKLQPGVRPRVVTAQGSVTASHVVLAGNAYLGGLEPRLAGYVLPAGSYLIATEPLGEARARALIPQNLAICDQNVVLDYFRCSADHRLLFGGRCNYSGREPRDIGATLLPRLRKVFPQLRDVKVDYAWGGNIGISINRIPQLGRLPGNILYAQGYSGHGVGTTHMAGRVLAEAISGDSARLDLFDRIHHWRLPGGRWFGSPALALGMLYYRLLDLL